jgi:hypothetical protein
MKKREILIISLLFILSLSFTINYQQIGASIEEADIKRQEGLYKEAITEYKKYEDFYNYNLLRNINNPQLYREYSRLLAGILIKIAESYNDWERYRGVEAYCDKVIFLSERIGNDRYINPIKKRALELLKSLGRDTAVNNTTDDYYSDSENLYIDSEEDAKDNEKVTIFVSDDGNNNKENENNANEREDAIEINVDEEKEKKDPIINSEEIEIPDEEPSEYLSYEDKKKEEKVKLADVNNYGEMSENDFIRLEREDEKSLLADEPVTEEELNKTMDDLKYYLAQLDGSYTESTTIIDDDGEEFNLSETDVADLDGSEDIELPESFEVYLEEDNETEGNSETVIEEDDETESATITDLPEIDDDSTTPVIEDDERPSSPFEIEDTDYGLDLITDQKFNPQAGPVTSQLLNNKYSKSSIVMHLTKFGQVLKNRIEKPTFVSISDGEKTLTYSEPTLSEGGESSFALDGDNDEIEVNSLTTENVRIYVSLNLSKTYTNIELDKLSHSLTQFLLSLPLGYRVYLSRINNTEVDFVPLNSNNLFSIIELLKDSSETSTNDLLKKTYEQIAKDDNVEKNPRFLILMSDSPDVINIGISKQANELSIPLHIFSISETLSGAEEKVLSRASSNTFGTYSYGDMETNLTEYLYNIALYLVQGSFIISWDKDAFSNLDNLLINIKFLYDKQIYEITFDTSLIPIIY